jgi:Predicted membrane protein
MNQLAVRSKGVQMSGANRIVALAAKAYELVVKICDLLRHPLLLLFRLNWGLQFYQTGLGKLKNHKDIVEYFTSLNIPLPDLNAWIAAGVECFGGILLMIGLASRPVATLTAFTMIVAYMAVSDDRQTVFDFFANFFGDSKKQDPFLQAAPFFFLLTSLLVLAFGPGVFSLDFLIGKLVKKKLGDQSAQKPTDG